MPLPAFHRILTVFCLTCLVTACGRDDSARLNAFLARRPANASAIVDPVGLLTDARESTERHLTTIRDRYGIEILIVTLLSLENRYTINQAAAELFTNWEIGNATRGRGILLLFVEDEKTVKFEVSYALEDVFTDAFTGHIQDIQLQPRYAADQLAIGFIAVMEAIESRARIKFGGSYTPRSIAALDLDYLSQGAGAGKHLAGRPEATARRPAVAGDTVNTAYPAGATPEAAWQTMIRCWRDRVKDPNLGVYTPLTRLAYRDFVHQPDARLEQQYATYAARQYAVRRAGDVAVIDFGNREGWDNAPFLLCRTDAGWQFDIVHQRRFIRMGRAPHWGVEFSEHPHMQLLMDRFNFQGQDIPVDGDDRYSIDRDGEWAGQILVYEVRLKQAPQDTGARLQLGRLYAITAMGSKAIPLLKQVLGQSPGSLSAMKYLAIAHVDAHYQYDTALTYLTGYIEGAGNDPFGHNFSGYIHYRKKRYEAAAQAFERALAIDPDSCYAHFYLTCTYARRYADASAFNPMRKKYRQRFHQHRQRTGAFAHNHPLRVAWLNRWLDGQ